MSQAKIIHRQLLGEICLVYFQNFRQLMNLKCGEKARVNRLHQITIWESTNYNGLKVGEANFMPIFKQTFRS
jgi:hypothetical protein